MKLLVVALLAGALLPGCPSVQLCGGVQCAANATCAPTETGEACRCADGYVERSGRCQPEGPCGRLAEELCRAVGGDAAACGALHEGVATADGPVCERRLDAADRHDDIDWIGEVEPMLARDLPAGYRAFLTRSLLDPCGAATELLCTVMRPGERGCGAAASAQTGDDRSCREVLRGYDGAIVAGAAQPPEAGGAPDAAASALGGGVLVHLIPDPANRGTMPPTAFREKLVARRGEIEACYRGALGNYPGLAGRAVYVVRIDANGVATVELGRADGPIVGAGVAQCVLEVLLLLDFSATPPTGGNFDVHVAFDFGE